MNKNSVQRKNIEGIIGAAGDYSHYRRKAIQKND